MTRTLIVNVPNLTKTHQAAILDAAGRHGFQTHFLSGAGQSPDLLRQAEIIFGSSPDLAKDAPELAGQALHTPLDELLQRADIVVAMLPLSNETLGLMGAREFGLMKPGAIFVNGGRGATVQETALLDALNHGTLRAAGLDVFATEPLPMDSPLRTHPKVTALPHIGSATFETRHAMALLATTNLLQALAGEAPQAVFELPPG